MKNLALAATCGALLLALAACTSNSSTSPDAAAKRFTVTLRSVPGGPSPLSPGVFVVHDGGKPLFTQGALAGPALERQAEDGDPSQLAMGAGTIFNTPVGDASPGPATPGKYFSFSFEAAPGDRLSFSSMYGQSNDCFYAPADAGMPLFDGQTPVTGDVTNRIYLWDAGTEINEPPGLGPNQAPRQGAPDTGPAESVGVDLVSHRDTYSYGSAIQAIIEAQ